MQDPGFDLRRLRHRQSRYVPHDACHKKRLKPGAIDLGREPPRRAVGLLAQAKDAILDARGESGRPQCATTRPERAPPPPADRAGWPRHRREPGSDRRVEAAPSGTRTRARRRSSGPRRRRADGPRQEPARSRTQRRAHGGIERDPGDGNAATSNGQGGRRVAHRVVVGPGSCVLAPEWRVARRWASCAHRAALPSPSSRAGVPRTRDLPRSRRRRSSAARWRRDERSRGAIRRGASRPRGWSELSPRDHGTEGRAVLRLRRPTSDRGSPRPRNTGTSDRPAMPSSRVAIRARQLTSPLTIVTPRTSTSGEASARISASASSGSAPMSVSMTIGIGEVTRLSCWTR